MNKTAGWINGFLGVLIFSGSLPAMRLAVIDIDPTFLTMARASIAGLLGMVFLLLFREPFPRKSDAVSLVVVALGVVVGFPLLTGLALQHMTSARAIVFIGLLPLSTAIFAVLRGGERPRPLFWLFSVVGSLVVASYAYGQGSQSTLMGDGLMLAAIIVCGLGYAEGARLSRRLGGWQVICWALVFALPVMLPLSVFTRPETWNGIGAMAWGGLAYVSLFSMLIGFVFWYRGLAQGGTATVGQLQLLQPFFGLMLAAGVAGEPVSMGMVATAAVVVVCVAGAKKFA
ncbi:DMT family transporter [Brucella melitensis]|uniref:DMT family transporter n=1 Tax=Brucella melitensis TaxID=29459 RepID=UPI000BC09362|nr:DMT family transporter [Brucella melitensis]ASZ28828.1 EamA family transporter [Brucella melitensis]AUS54764.1 EamA family transporter [Brucella melitensis]AWT06439.1 EamA/RhaT family transporter [Brucella melitensis]